MFVLGFWVILYKYKNSHYLKLEEGVEKKYCTVHRPVTIHPSIHTKAQHAHNRAHTKSSRPKSLNDIKCNDMQL